MAKLICVDGTIKEVLPENGKCFAFSEVYKLIGCEFIEILPTINYNQYMAVDEEGTLRSKMINRIATALCRTPIVGDVLVGTYNELHEEDYDIPDDLDRDMTPPYEP